MKKLICLALAACMLLSLAACGEAKAETASETPASAQEPSAVDVPKSEQTGTAGSNIPLKDNPEEAKYQIEVAMQKLLEEGYGDKVNDARIYVERIYTAEDEQAIEPLKSMNLGADEVAFEVKYELHPAEGVDVNELTAATGKYDEASGWVTEKYNVGVLRPDSDGSYTITDFGTAF